MGMTDGLELCAPDMATFAAQVDTALKALQSASIVRARAERSKSLRWLQCCPVSCEASLFDALLLQLSRQRTAVHAQAPGCL